MQVLDVLMDTYMLGTGHCELGECPGKMPLCPMMRCIIVDLDKSSRASQNF